MLNKRKNKEGFSTTSNYYSGYRTPLVQGTRNRRMFDSLTYDFPYLKLI